MIWAVILNVSFSALSGYLAKIWSQTDQWIWLGIAVLTNMVAFLALAWAVRSAGLGVATAIVLLLTIAANTMIGVLVFRESLSVMQIWGLGLAAGAIVLLAWPSKG